MGGRLLHGRRLCSGGRGQRTISRHHDAPGFLEGCRLGSRLNGVSGHHLGRCNLWRAPSCDPCGFQEGCTLLLFLRLNGSIQPLTLRFTPLACLYRSVRLLLRQCLHVYLRRGEVLLRRDRGCARPRSRSGPAQPQCGFQLLCASLGGGRGLCLLLILLVGLGPLLHHGLHGRGLRYRQTVVLPGLSCTTR